MELCEVVSRYGGHVTKEKTLYSTIKNNEDMRSQQVYIGNKYSYNVSPIEESDITKVISYCSKTDTHVFVHASLVCNLGNVEDKAIVSKTINHLQGQVNQMEGVPGSIVSHIGAKGTIEKVTRSINKIDVSVCKPIPKLLLENSAGEGTKLGSTYDELCKIREGIDKVEGRIGFCIDTQHSFASGLCDFGDIKVTEKFFDKMDDIGGINLFHVNDSMVELGSKVDRHEIIGGGRIWGSHRKNASESFQYFFDQCTIRGIDMVSETPDVDHDIKIFKEYTS